MQHTLHYVRVHMITSSRRASLSMLAHRTRILSSLHAHQLASPSAPDGPPSLHVQRAEDAVTSGRAARCSASACEAATWTCSSTTARELPVLSGFCILLLNGAPPPHCPTTAGTACARQLGSSPASLSAAACMHAQSRAPAAHAPRCWQRILLTTNNPGAQVLQAAADARARALCYVWAVSP